MNILKSEWEFSYSDFLQDLIYVIFHGYLAGILPFGETVLEQMDGSYNNPYKFNAKELDEDTGLYYYGARYYNPRLSIWYGVDPLTEKMPSWSPYNYTFDNPVRYIDPTGMAPLTDYKLLQNGKTERVDKNDGSEKNNYDRLYATDDKGNINKSNFIDITKSKPESGSIISDLSTNRKDEFGFGGSDLRIAITNNRANALDVYQFAALNSTNEWSIQSNTINGKNEYAFGTQLHPTLSPNYLAFDKLGYSLKTLNWDMHSHGTLLGTNGPSSGDREHVLSDSTTRFLFRTNGNERGKIYPYGKTFNNSSLFKQRNFGDMTKKISNYSDFK